ncbi:MAG: hypothetical protein JO290_09325, partial [Sphingomonadaceae bacterium]|nr:hypothetical protein [Sphingomonadaceae bacterium]
AHYALGEAITFDANAGFIRNDYKQSFSIPGEVARINETTKQVGLAATFAPRKLYDVTLSVSQVFRNANPSVLNYDSTKVGLTLAVHI